MSDDLKAAAGEAALEYVRDGMTLGIGTGSTAEAFIHALGKKVADGFKITGIPTSERTAALCEKLGIALTTLEACPALDLTIDGTDELNPALDLIKGGGGALLREKIVAAASREMIVIADESKCVADLGAFDLPIEVNIFGVAATQNALSQLAQDEGLPQVFSLRTKADGQPYVTDGGHYIIDASFGRIVAPKVLEGRLNAIPGVVENGLFTGLATRAIIAGEGGVRIVEPNS